MQVIYPIRLLAVLQGIGQKGAHATYIHRTVAHGEIKKGIWRLPGLENPVAIIGCAAGTNNVEHILAKLLVDHLPFFVPVRLNRDPALLHHNSTVLPALIIGYSRSIAAHTPFPSFLSLSYLISPFR